MPDSGAGSPPLTIRALHKVYPGRAAGHKVVALAGIDLGVPPGEFLAIVGPSGCGKSTLLRIIAGLEVATEGEVLVDGAPVTGPAPGRGMMFQEYALFPWKPVWQNVEFGPRARGWPKERRDEIVRTYIDLVGLTGFEDKYPFELSGGMRQRCALARLLANEPQILLMDEPLAAVDAQTRSILQDETLRLWGEEHAQHERRTVIYVTHSIEEAVYLADRVVVLHARPGRIAADIRIDLPRPRSHGRAGHAFDMYQEQIWQLIRDEAYQAVREGA